MKNQLVIAVIVSLVVGAAGGYAVGRGGATPEERVAQIRQQAAAAAREQAFEEINQKFVERGLSYPATQEVREVYGFVKEVSGDSLVIEYQSAQFSVLQSGMVTKRVTLASGATVEKMVEREAEEDAPAEVVPGSASLGGAAPPAEETSQGGSLGVLKAPPPPEPTIGGEQSTQVAVRISLSELKTGDYVRVMATSDVQDAEVISATSVTVYDMSRLPPGVTPDPGQMPFSRLIDNPPPVMP